MSTPTRTTKQRTAILDALRSTTSHPTADELYTMVRKIIPNISLGTVYRNLDVLNASGEILLLEQAGQQKRFDGNTSPHYHVKCEQCGCVGDVHTSVLLPDVSLLSAFGFDSINSAELILHGTCEQCSAIQQ